MKKLSVFFVLFTIIAAAGFAQANISGYVSATLLMNSEQNGPAKGGWEGSLSLWRTVISGDKKTGGWISLAGKVGEGIDLDMDKTYIGAWWRPIPQIYFGLGKVDGYWVGSDITGEGFQEGSDRLVGPEFAGKGEYLGKSVYPDSSIYQPALKNGYAGNILGEGHGFITGKQGDMAVNLSVFPISDLVLNIGWSLFQEPATGYFDHLSLQAAYTIPDGGTVAANYNNAEKGKPKDLALSYRLNPQISGFEGFEAFEIGAYAPLYDIGDSWRFIDAGLGARYRQGDFLLTLRTGLEVPFVNYYKDTQFGFDICPSYRFDFFRLYVPMGIGLISNSDTNDTVFAWSVNPYFIKPMGGIELYMGFMLYNGADTTTKIN
ncbi:MAG: hypothetical protein FWF29_06000, partial [Treponema sp.]|nr:hypothetical protein [Treponema sp.]